MVTMTYTSAATTMALPTRDQLTLAVLGKSFAQEAQQAENGVVEARHMATLSRSQPSPSFVPRLQDQGFPPALDMRASPSSMCCCSIFQPRSWSSNF